MGRNIPHRYHHHVTSFFIIRSVQSSGLIQSSPRASAVTAASSCSTGVFSGTSGIKVKADDPTFVFTPVSPRSAPSGSNAPDFFVASTRSTADVKSSYSGYCRVLEDSSISAAGLLHSGGGEYSVKNEFHQTSSSFSSSSSSPNSNSNSNNNNSQVKIFASLSPKRDGSSSTRIISSRSIRDSLPKELIDKIKAASQGRKTIAIIEPITRNNTSNRLEANGASGGDSVMDSLMGGGGGRYSGLSSRFSVAAANLNRWRSVGVVPPLSNSNNNISDHDYCCPSRPGGRYRYRHSKLKSTFLKAQIFS